MFRVVHSYIAQHHFTSPSLHANHSYWINSFFISVHAWLPPQGGIKQLWSLAKLVIHRIVSPAAFFIHTYSSEQLMLKAALSIWKKLVFEFAVSLASCKYGTTLARPPNTILNVCLPTYSELVLWVGFFVCMILILQKLVCLSSVFKHIFRIKNNPITVFLTLSSIL